MPRSRCRSWHLGNSRSVKGGGTRWGGGWVPVINTTTVDGEIIVIETCWGVALDKPEG